MTVIVGKRLLLRLIPNCKCGPCLHFLCSRKCYASLSETAVKQKYYQCFMLMNRGSTQKWTRGEKNQSSNWPPVLVKRIRWKTGVQIATSKRDFLRSETVHTIIDQRLVCNPNWLLACTWNEACEALRLLPLISLFNVETKTTVREPNLPFTLDCGGATTSLDHTLIMTRFAAHCFTRVCITAAAACILHRVSILFRFIMLGPYCVYVCLVCSSCIHLCPCRM